jgi:hypothetical protein
MSAHVADAHAALCARFPGLVQVLRALADRTAGAQPTQALADAVVAFRDYDGQNMQIVCSAERQRAAGNLRPPSPRA